MRSRTRKKTSILNARVHVPWESRNNKNDIKFANCVLFVRNSGITTVEVIACNRCVERTTVKGDATVNEQVQW